MVILKKVLSLFLLTILLTGLVGCSNYTNIKALHQGKLALENKEYDKALSLFELAINEGNNNEKVMEIYDILIKYKEVRSYLDAGDIENAEETLNSINSNYDKYPIKDDIDELMVELDELKISKQKDIEEREKQERAEQIEQEKQAKAEEVRLAKSSKKNKYLQKYDEMEVKEYEIYTNTQYASDATTKSYELWDDFLNEIWGVLKQELPKNEMDNLTKIQIEWIKDKEAKQKRSYDAGNNTSTAVGETVELTKVRCWELIDWYMN